MIGTWAVRAANGVRKVLAGLRPFGESVWPGVRNDLFVAHESLYAFAAPLARGRNVLDAGCGTGYGASLLASSGASAVDAVDVDALSVRYARRRYGGPSLSFSVADLDREGLPEGRYGLVFCSNVLEHLEAPDVFLSRAFGALRPGGVGLFAVPPILSEADLEVHARIHYHRSNLTVSAWHALFSALPWSVDVLAHRCPGARPDFGSPRPSRLSAGDFVVAPETLAAIGADPPITVVFRAERREAGG